MKVIDAQTVHSMLPLKQAIILAKVAFELVAQQAVIQPLRSIIPGGDQGLMGTMPALIQSGPYQGFGVKSVVVKFDHSTQSKPSHNGLVLVYDLNGLPACAVDAAAITEIRTAAASAVATDLLAPAQAHRLAILGTGLQAKAHIEAICAVRPIEQVRIWGRSTAAGEQLAAWASTHLSIDCSFSQVMAATLQDADIICTTTAAKQAILFDQDIATGRPLHINAIGASALGFQELDASLFKLATLFTDCNHAVLASAQSVRLAVEAGYVHSQQPGIEIGRLLCADPPHITRQPLTLFKSVGLAVQDLVVARYILQQVQR